jgi:hypothetical protein
MARQKIEYIYEYFTFFSVSRCIQYGQDWKIFRHILPCVLIALCILMHWPLCA